MNPLFHICQHDGCSITITGLSYDEGLYLEETATVQPYDKFKYSDTTTIDAVVLNTVESTLEPEKLVITDKFIIPHCAYLDEAHCKLNKDGYYTISHIILPTKAAIDRIISDDSEFINQYNYVYAEDNNSIIKLLNGKWVEASIEEIVLLNDNCNTTIFKSSKDLFSICHLWNCYVDICKELLSSNLNKCKKNPDVEDLIFNRDVIWMTINVLNYLPEKDQLYEAERILEEVKGCNGLCQESKRIKKKGGCGYGR